MICSNMSRSNRCLRIAVLFVVGWIAAAAPSSGYRMIQSGSIGRITGGAMVSCHAAGGVTRWGSPSIAWRHNLALDGSGKASALQAALATWTHAGGTDYVLTYAGTTTAGFVTDGLNTMVWKPNPCGGCLAVTALVLQSGQVIVESDIAFDSNFTWTTNGNDFDTQAVATHELGHSLGIFHTEIPRTIFTPTSTIPTMDANYFGQNGRTLEVDDRFGVQCAQEHPQMTACTWSADIKESNGTAYICPSGKVMAGRRHSGDENGNTRYLCCTAGSPQATPTSCTWSTAIKESNGTPFTCTSNKVLVGRQHSGDENGNTWYYCCNLSRGGVTLGLDAGSCAWSPSQKESSSNFECPATMVGRQHSGDENGSTWNYCCSPNW